MKLDELLGKKKKYRKTENKLGGGTDWFCLEPLRCNGTNNDVTTLCYNYTMIPSNVLPTNII